MNLLLRSLLGATICLGLLLGAALPGQSETVRYDIVTNGEVNGSLEVVKEAANSFVLRNRYQSQDKVRELLVRTILDPNAIPIRTDRTGQSFAFQPIEEHFERQGEWAIWRNRIESSRARAARGAYYVPLGLSLAGDSAAYELGMLAAAALKAPGARLALLPVGSVQARILARQSVSAGGRREEVRLVQLTGLGIEPDYVWLDKDDQLFTARGTIRTGWRSVLPVLDKARADADAAQVVRSLEAIRMDPTDLLIKDVALFDPARERVLNRRDVLIRGGRIAEVAMHGKLRSRSAGAREIAGRGQTLLPGLWDMHVHLSGARESLRHLASGVTTVRDMGNDNAALATLIGRIRSGQVLGPNVVKAGFIEGRSPSATYTGRLVDSEAAAVAAVNAYADEGAVQIKLYNAVRPEWVPAIARTAHKRGLRLSGHIPFGSRAETMVDAGFDEIQHWVFLFLNFSPDPVITGLTFNTARIAKTIDFQSPAFRQLVEKLRENRVVTDLTLTVYEPLMQGKAGLPAPVFTRSAVPLPPAMLRQIALGPLPTPTDMTAAEFQGAYRRAMALAKLLDASGVQIVAGTDFAPLPGLAFPRELELLVEAGLSPARVLRIATLDAARVMGMAQQSGSIEVGKVADLILVRGDPTRNIAQVREVEFVVKGGRLYRPAQLLQASGIQ